MCIRGSYLSSCLAYLGAGLLPLDPTSTCILVSAVTFRRPTQFPFVLIILAAWCVGKWTWFDLIWQFAHWQSPSIRRIDFLLFSIVPKLHYEREMAHCILNQAYSEWQALPGILCSALCFHGNETRAPIANPPNSAQLEGTPYRLQKLHPGPCSSVGMRRGTDRQTTDIQTNTQTRVTNIHIASSTTRAKCNNANSYAILNQPSLADPQV